MNDFLNYVVGGNTIRSYLWAVGTILFVLVISRFLSKYIASLVCRLFSRIWKNFDKTKFTELVAHPLSVFLVITVSIAALYRLNFPPELDVKIYKYPLDKIILSIGITIQIIAFVWLLMRIIDFIATVLESRAALTPSQSDNQLVVFFRDFLKVILGIIGVMLVLHFAFSYNVTSLLTGLSIVGAAIALALRESLENLIASFVIFFDKPFFTGDFVRVQNVSGVVERIGLRSTRVRTADKSYVTVPNKQMVDSILDNVSQRSQIRGELNLFLELHTTPGQIEQLTVALKTFIASEPRISSHTILFNDIRQQGHLVFVEYFTPPMAWPEFTAIRQRVNFFALRTIEDLEITLAAHK
jgi:MscS family membrane protein